MISINYDPFGKTFANSRRDLEWQEIEYFIDKYLKKELRAFSILDVGCGNARFVGFLQDRRVSYIKYLGIDSSQVLLDEAKKDYPSNAFELLDMNNLDSIKGKFTDIFFIASFHHLETFEERQKVLKKAYDLLEDGGNIYMTNWSLESEINYMRYRNSKIEGSENDFGSSDFQVKIGEYKRFYHCFHISELEHLIKEAGFILIENKEFENKKNLISIAKKIEA